MTPEKLLLTTANQSVAFLQQLDTELCEIREALYKAGQRDQVVVDEKGSVDYRTLWDYLNSAAGQTVTMFHYIGHSSAQGVVVHGTDQQPVMLAKTDLVGLFRQPQRLRFMFLNSCCSADIAQALLQAGIPYVIGTSRTVADKQAAQVAAKFYEMLGNVFDPRTIEEAYRETQTYFDNDPQNPIPRPANHVTRGAFMTDTNEVDSFPWQLYQRDDLSDAQRTWRLIPVLAARPPVLNARYVVTPNAPAGKPFSFFLSHHVDDQLWADELVRQIRTVFWNYGSVASVWSDDSQANADELAEQIEQADYLFLLMRDAYMENSLAQQVLTQAKQRAESGRLAAPPILFTTNNGTWEGQVGRTFNRFPLSGKPLTTDLVSQFSPTLYANWMRRF